MANLSNLNNKFLVTTGGNVLINKTAANNATVGTQIMSTGDVNATVSGDTVARFNRLSSDGEIIRFQNDTATDGAINCLSGRIAIGSSNTGIFFDSIRQVITPWDITDNDNEFNNISFGRSIVRFKDIYLSGKVVAGTGSTDAATINAFSTTVSAGLHSALRIIENTGASSYWDIGATNGASTILNFYHNAATTPKITFTHLGGATFADNVGIGTTSPTSPAGVAKFLEIEGSTAGIVLHDDGNDPYEIWASGGNLVFRYNNTGGENGMLLSSSGFLGIGTTSPSTKLDVRNNDGVGNGLHLIGDFSRAGGADAQLILGYFANGSAVTGPVVYAANSMPLLFSSGSVERMRIDSSGRVGIGMTPSNYSGYPLQLYGGSQTLMTFGNDTTGTGALNGLVVGCDSTGADIYQREAQPLRFHTSNIERMRINSSGNVGIGTTVPSSRLSISGSQTAIDLTRGTAGDSKWGFSSDSTALYIAELSTGSTDYIMTLKETTGNVGIGTTSPMTLLHVQQSDGGYPDDANNHLVVESSSHSYIGLGGGTSSDVGIHFGDDDSMNQGRIAYQNSDDSLNFSTFQNVRMKITSAGNVGIGTTPGKKLDVNGDAQVDFLYQRQNSGTATTLTTPRILNIAYPGANGTFSFNPVELFGCGAAGGQVELQVSGWRMALNNGFIYWRDNGSNTIIANGEVAFAQTAYNEGAQTGSNTLSVACTSGNIITITFAGWHTNGHGWQAKIISDM